LAEEVHMESENGFDIPDMIETQNSLGWQRMEIRRQWKNRNNKRRRRMAVRRTSGAVIAERRSTTIKNDGRTSLEKAKDQKRRSFWRTSIRKVRPKNPAEFLNLRSLKSWLKW
jgi:hypothetical protein